jgi:hypothetical protein
VISKKSEKSEKSAVSDDKKSKVSFKTEKSDAEKKKAAKPAEKKEEFVVGRYNPELGLKGNNVLYCKNDG